MLVDVVNECPEATSYRAARIRSMFNAGPSNVVHVRAELPLEDVEGGWSIGVVVGPSGSGKTTIGRALWEGAAYHQPGEGWPEDAPIIDAVAPDGDFDAATTALSQVGLGDVPAWLRPYRVLSMGERFRADLARIVASAGPDTRVVVDEFTSVVDRQIARVGAGASAKTWRRTGGQAVLLSCHYDILDWLEPDWVYDTSDQEFRITKGCLQRPRLTVEVVETGWGYWPLFKPHHYLEAGPMPISKAYVGFVDDQPVVHLGMSSKNLNGRRPEYRACRMVVMPEWQGAGVGMRFLNHLCQGNLDGQGHLGYPATTQFHTSHPGLVQALRRDPRWRQVSAHLGASEPRRNARARLAKAGKIVIGYGGHLRAVQGFRYVGVRPS